MTINMNGTTSKLTYANLFDARSAHSAAFYVYWSPFVSNQRLLSVNNGAGAEEILFYMSGTTGTMALSEGGGGTLVRVTATPVMSASNLYHVAYTWDGTGTATGIHIYIDGVECTYGTTTNGTRTTAATGTWSFGCRSADDARTANASIVAIGVWNRVLSASEVKMLASNGYARQTGASFTEVDAGYASYVGDSCNCFDMIRNCTTYFYKPITLFGDYQARFECRATAFTVSTPANPYMGCFAATSAYGTHGTLVGQMVYMTADTADSNKLKLVLWATNNAGGTLSNEISLNTWYYCTITRLASTVTLTIRTDSHTGSVFQTLSQTCLTTTYGYFQSLFSRGAAGNDKITGSVANLDIYPLKYIHPTYLQNGLAFAPLLLTDARDGISGKAVTANSNNTFSSSGRLIFPRGTGGL